MRLAAYEKYNGSALDEKELVEKAIKLSLTAESSKQERFKEEDYAYKPEYQAEVIREPSRPNHPQQPEEKKSKKKSRSKPKIMKEAKTGPLAG